MEFEEMTAVNLRIAARHFAPESRGVGGIAHSGSKEQLIELLRNKGVMACEAAEYLAGNNNVSAPAASASVPLTGMTEEPKAEDEVVEPEVISNGANEQPMLPSVSDSNAGNNSTEEHDTQHDTQHDTKHDTDSDTDDDELEIIRRIITKKVKQEASVNEAEVSKIIDERLEKFADAIRKEIRKKTVKVIEVKQVDMPNKPIGACHCMTEQIAMVANVGVHQMLVGPAGSGKTTCCEKVAEILNLKFYPMSVGPQTTKSDLLGFIDAAGNYHTTPLREAFENGGLLLLDEVDAANAGVLTIINSLLANGYCSFPDGVKQRNDSFRCICACNTYGRGADRQYVGRNQLDAATLDRFAVVDFDYDEALEKAIAGNDAWTEKVQAYRKKAFALKQRVVISPRASIYGAKLLAAGMPESKVEELVVWKGISKDIRTKIQGF